MFCNEAEVNLAAARVSADSDDGSESSISEGSELVEEMIADWLWRHSPEVGLLVPHYFIEPWLVKAGFVNMVALSGRDDTAEVLSGLITVIIRL